MPLSGRRSRRISGASDRTHGWVLLIPVELRDVLLVQHVDESVLNGHDAVLLGLVDPLACQLVDVRLTARDAEIGDLSAAMTSSRLPRRWNSWRRWKR